MALLFIWTLKKKPALHWIFIWLGKPCKTLGTCSATCQLPQRNNDLRRGEWEMWKIVSVLKHILWEQVQAKKQSEGERNPVQPQAQGKGAALQQPIFSLCHEVNWSCLKRQEKESERMNLIHFKNATLCHVMGCGLYWWHICTSRDRNSSISESSSVPDSIKK